MVADMLAPSQRLIPDPHPALRRPFAQFSEIVRRPVDPAQRLGVARRAIEHQIGAKLAHQVEFALGPVEGFGAVGFRQALKVAERLKQRDLEPVVAHHPAHGAGRTVEGDEILFEDFDPVVARRRDGLQLVRQ